MDIGVPRERRVDEYRVGLTPAGVALLTAGGHTCRVERDAGRGAGFSDVDYEKAGGQIVYSSHEAYGRADLVVKVGPLSVEETGWLKEGAIVMGFLHLAAGRREAVERLLAGRITAVAYETIQQDDGSLPVLIPLSQIAGGMAPQLAARLCQNDHGGKGILLGGVTGVPPAEVVIVGGGSVGVAAARAFLGVGAAVYVLDRDLSRLQRLDELWGLGRRAVTMVSHDFNVRRCLRFADVVVGAVLVPGALAPQVITREMVKGMKPRSVLMDIAIDQGGCAETSRPTSHRDPTYVEEGVIHYCVPNMTSVVARTATHGFNNAAWPFMCQVARSGLEQALARLPALGRGVATHGGQVINPALAAHLGLQEGSL